MSITEDVSQPAAVHYTTLPANSGSFTPPSGTLLAVLVSHDSSATSVDTITDSLSGSWTELKFSNTFGGSLGGAASIWVRDSPGAAITVTLNATNAGTGHGSLAVRVLKGALAAASQPGASAAAGTTSTTSMQIALTPTQLGSRIYGSLVDFTTNVTMTPLATSADVDNFSDAGSGDTYDLFKASADTASLTSTTYGYASPGNHSCNVAAVEFLAAATGGSAQPLVVSPIWTPARTTPILSSSFPLGNPAVRTPAALVVGPPFAWVSVPVNYISASKPLGNPAVGTPGPLVVSTPWVSRVPGALIVSSPIPPPVVTGPTPGPLVVTPPFAWVSVPVNYQSASQPLGNPAVGTPGPLVVSAPWTSRVPGALIVTSPVPPPVVTIASPAPLVVSPPFAWVLVPPGIISASPPSAPAPGPLVSAPPFAWTYIPPVRLTASQPLGNPAVPTPGPALVSPPFLWTPVPISRLFAAPPLATVQLVVPVEFVIEPPQRLWQIAMLSPSAGWQPDPPVYTWEAAMLSPSTEITFEPPRRLWEISMDVERISSLSLERIRFPVFADTGGTVYNPTADAVSMAFLPSSVDPQPTDFHVGTWDTTVIGTYVAQILVGPTGSVTLAKGTYYAWVKIVDSGGETIVRQVGQLIVD